MRGGFLFLALRLNPLDLELLRGGLSGTARRKVVFISRNIDLIVFQNRRPTIDPIHIGPLQTDPVCLASREFLTDVLVLLGQKTFLVEGADTGVIIRIEVVENDQFIGLAHKRLATGLRSLAIESAVGHGSRVLELHPHILAPRHGVVFFHHVDNEVLRLQLAFDRFCDLDRRFSDGVVATVEIFIAEGADDEAGIIDVAAIVLPQHDFPEGGHPLGFDALGFRLSLRFLAPLLGLALGLFLTLASDLRLTLLLHSLAGEIDLREAWMVWADAPLNQDRDIQPVVAQLAHQTTGARLGNLLPLFLRGLHQGCVHQSTDDAAQGILLCGGGYGDENRQGKRRIKRAGIEPLPDQICLMHRRTPVISENLNITATYNP